MPEEVLHENEDELLEVIKAQAPFKDKETE